MSSGPTLLRWGRSLNSPALEREARLFFGVSAELSAEELAAIAPHYPVFRIAPDEDVPRRRSRPDSPGR